MKSLLLVAVAMISVQAFAQTTSPFSTPGLSPNTGLTPGVFGQQSGVFNPQPVGGSTPSPVPTLTPGVTTGLNPTPVTGLTPNPVGGLTPNPVGGLVSEPVPGFTIDPATGLNHPSTTIGTVPALPNTTPLTTPEGQTRTNGLEF